MSIFHPHYSVRSLLAGVIGFLTALALSYNLGFFTISSIVEKVLPHHPVTHEGEVHVHADFQMYIKDERVRFTDEKYQSVVGHTLDASQHFHDGNDDVIHRHANNVTLANFFRSIGVTLTDTCLTLDTEKKYCTDSKGTLTLLVNGMPVTDIEHYITTEKDRILLHYGDPKNPRLTEYMNGVTDQACMYSHTCPERGEPPTENCGLTCDVANTTHQP